MQTEHLRLRSMNSREPAPQSNTMLCISPKREQASPKGLRLRRETVAGAAQRRAQSGRARTNFTRAAALPKRVRFALLALGMRLSGMVTAAQSRHIASATPYPALVLQARIGA